MSEIRSKSGLAIVLSKLKTFEKPKVRVEQYSMDSEIAAEVLWNGLYRGDIQKVIVDLGCGTGMLAGRGLSARPSVGLVRQVIHDRPLLHSAGLDHAKGGGGGGSSPRSKASRTALTGIRCSHGTPAWHKPHPYPSNL